ncbi:MAG: hypothetical protein ABI779_24795 [Acidobacteriota bacterium]
MNIIRGRVDAQWLPLRHNFALFRLYALVGMVNSRPVPGDVAVVVDRHQSAGENFLVGAWTTLTLSCYAAHVLSARSWTLAAIAALPLAIVLMHVPIVTFGVLFMKRGNNLRLNSMILMASLTGAAAYFARDPSWVRFVAWQFLAILALNGVAAVALLPFRGVIARWETSLGGYSSEL